MYPDRTLQYAAAADLAPADGLAFADGLAPADDLIAPRPRVWLRGTKGAAEAVEASKTTARIELADTFMIKNSVRGCEQY